MKGEKKIGDTSRNIYWRIGPRSLCLTLALCMLALAPLMWEVKPVRAEEDADCALASKIAEKASQEFAKDQSLGLKYFLQAKNLCPAKPELNFNLGLAYYRYGNRSEAEQYLKKAVEKEGNMADWLNLLAWVMLEQGSDAKEVLTYAKKAIKLSPNTPAYLDTLIYAYLANDNVYQAAIEAKKARESWPQEEKINERYHQAMDDYLAFYLKKLEAGNGREAVDGLAKIDFDPQVAIAHCWALHKAGNTEVALSRARSLKSKFSDEEPVQPVFDQIMDQYIQSCYRIFQEVKPSEAIHAVEKMRGQYPACQELSEAYDQMMKVVLKEADTLIIPAPKSYTPSAARVAGESGRLLDKFIQGGGYSQPVDLEVDVDKNIPQGGEENPEAVAVIIGNRHYSRFGHSPDVEYADRDAAYVKMYAMSLLGYREKRIIHLSDATKGQMEKVFGTQRNPGGQLNRIVKQAAGKAEVFIYYSGHGAPAEQGKKAFLLPVDGDADNILTTGYPLEILYQNLAKMHCKKITLVLDTCFSGDSIAGRLDTNISPGHRLPANPIAALDNSLIFTSAGQGQVSHWYPEKRHSLFTYFFLKALQGEADQNADQNITAAELKTYLVPKVRDHLTFTEREQVPSIVGDDNWVVARMKKEVEMRGKK